MELREFAERVLFATTLEEKLRRPDRLTDERPGPALTAPEFPGRPPELRFKSSGSRRAPFPSVHRLEQESERGRLLHFFANHELLATELMALVLLRFPDAPPEFRRGVLETLQDEQIHTQLYRKRMLECGVEFGDLPVSGYFWRAVSGMESPMDFVAGLSLTFEQANLDFCGHFAQAFRAVDDSASARILDRIYRDEIGHVAHGWKWFRRWKNPSEDDWQAFCRQLKFPLSPQRAKGFRLNIAGRQAAGLAPDFIAQLDVYSQSKGRPPNVYVFNPFTEGFLAQGPTFNPNKHGVALAADLSNLPQYLGRGDDVVLVPQRPSLPWLATLKAAGFPLPEFVEYSGAGLPPDHPLLERKLGGLRPWAWGPESVALLGRLFENIAGGPSRSGAPTALVEAPLPGSQSGLMPNEELVIKSTVFPEQLAALFSKAWSATRLREWLVDDDFLAEDRSWLCTPNEVGRAALTFAEVQDAIAEIRGRGHHRIIVKEALGVAGQNAIRLWEPEILETQRRWLERAVERGSVVVEPWLERLVDFSVHGEHRATGLSLCGYVGLLTDQRGQYRGNWAEPQSRLRPPLAVTEASPEVPNVRRRVQELYSRLLVRLERDLTTAGYLGPVGIDAFVYRATDGSPRLKPVVEINPRYTMGRVTLELMRQVSPGSTGHFHLVNRAQLRDEGMADFVAYADSLRGRYPIQMSGSPVAQIQSGAVCLSDPESAREYLAVFRVDPTGARHFQDSSVALGAPSPNRKMLS
ncbi:MAG TPA: DUF455 family protein [Verrucomicrobiota bacterium]|nr:DUF455 family protein [Verrucomicrobiota bacterium]